MITKSKGVPWFRIAAWARKGDWEPRCRGEDHLTYSRAADCIEVTLKDGRAVEAEWHRHGEGDDIVDTAVAKGDKLDTLEEWFD